MVIVGLVTHGQDMAARATTSALPTAAFRRPQCPLPTDRGVGCTMMGVPSIASGRAFPFPQPRANAPTLPGSSVKGQDSRSIYRGYTGIVQRISDRRAAVLFEKGNWDKLVTLDLSQLQGW